MAIDAGAPFRSPEEAICMKFKVEVIADNSGQWCGNGRVFDTREAAEIYARDLFSRWTAVREWRVIETEGQ